VAGRAVSGGVQHCAGIPCSMTPMAVFSRSSWPCAQRSDRQLPPRSRPKRSQIRVPASRKTMRPAGRSFEHEKAGEDLAHIARLHLRPQGRDLAAAQLVPVIEELDGGIETHMPADLFHFGSNGDHHGRLAMFMRVSCQTRPVKVKKEFRLCLRRRRGTVCSSLPALEVQHRLFGHGFILGGRSASRSVQYRTAFFLTFRPVSQCPCVERGLQWTIQSSRIRPLSHPHSRRARPSSIFPACSCDDRLARCHLCRAGADPVRQRHR
jgi:hypothetical protein